MALFTWISFAIAIVAQTALGPLVFELFVANESNTTWAARLADSSAVIFFIALLVFISALILAFFWNTERGLKKLIRLLQHSDKDPFDYNYFKTFYFISLFSGMILSDLLVLLGLLFSLSLKTQAVLLPFTIAGFFILVIFLPNFKRVCRLAGVTDEEKHHD